MKANLAQLRARRWMRQRDERRVEEFDLVVKRERLRDAWHGVAPSARHPINAIAGPQTYTPRGVR